MAQPLPNWLKPVTLRYQDSDQFTTGLVQLPITYSGPSIPLEWPYTSVPSNVLTASSPASSALPSPQIVRFLDGSGPFTVIGGVILTASTPAPSASAALPTSPPAAPSSMPVTPSPPVVLVTTVVVAQPTPASTPPSSESSNSPSYNPLALGFVCLLTILVILIMVATYILIKRQRRRRKLVGVIDKYDTTPQEIHYEFNSRLYPQHHDGSQAQPHCLRISHEAPVVTHEHEDACLDDDMKEKPALRTEFLLTPQGKPARTGRKWTRWNKLVPRLPFFASKNFNRAETVYHEPLPQTAPIYVNPYHDPSVNTNTGERVSKWRMQCGSFSSSAVKLPSTITSYANELPPANDLFQQNTPVKDGGLPHDPHSALSAIQRSDAKLVFSYNQSSTVSGPRGKSQSRAYQPLVESSPSSPLKAKSMEAVYTLLDLSSPRRGVVKSHTPKLTKGFIPSTLFKIPTHPSRSFGNKTKSSRTTAKGSTSKRYSDLEPPLLVDECEEDDEASGSDGTDPGDSPLDFITIPLRSPPRCRRGTASTIAGLPGLEDSIDSLGGCPRSLPPSSPTAPLTSSAKGVRPKKNSLPAFPLAQPSIPSQLNTGTSGDDHFLGPLKRVPDPIIPAVFPSLPIARVPVPKIGADDPTASYSTPQVGRVRAKRYSPAVIDDLSGNQSSLDTNLSHGAQRNETIRSHENSGGLSSQSSSASPQYPQDPSCVASNDGSPSRIPPEPQPPQPKSGSQETHNTSADEDIIFSGYFGSGSIGNTGGVSEMGILDTSL